MGSAGRPVRWTETLGLLALPLPCAPNSRVRPLDRGRCDSPVPIIRFLVGYNRHVTALQRHRDDLPCVAIFSVVEKMSDIHDVAFPVES